MQTFLKSFFLPAQKYFETLPIRNICSSLKFNPWYVIQFPAFGLHVFTLNHLSSLWNLIMASNNNLSSLDKINLDWVGHSICVTVLKLHKMMINLRGKYPFIDPDWGKVDALPSCNVVIRHRALLSRLHNRGPSSQAVRWTPGRVPEMSQTLFTPCLWQLVRTGFVEIKLNVQPFTPRHLQSHCGCVRGGKALELMKLKGSISSTSKKRVSSLCRTNIKQWPDTHHQADGSVSTKYSKHYSPLLSLYSTLSSMWY